LFAGVAIKYALIVMAPGLFYLMIKGVGWKKTIAGLSLGLLPVAALFYWYMSPMDRSHMDALATVFNIGQGSLKGLIGIWKVSALNNLLDFVIGAGCLAIAARCILRWTRQTNERQLQRLVLNDTVLFLVLLVCLYSARCQAWYPALFFPLALFLSTESRVRQFSILLTCLLTFSVMWFGLPSNYLMPIFLFLAFVASKITEQMSRESSTFQDSGSVDGNAVQCVTVTSRLERANS
jgi:hypothetical protein